MEVMTEQSAITPEELIELLKAATKNTRKHRSLDLIHEICSEQTERGSRDFSIATISKLSETRGGPKMQSIRNANGADYRAIINCWAKYTGGRNKRPPKEASDIYDRLLRLIPDPAVRAAMGAEMAEVRKLRRENSLLKQNAEIIIDQRPVAVDHHTSQQLESLSHIARYLKPTEIAALVHAIGPEHFHNQGWTAHSNGKVVTESGRMIFLPGFVTAIQKLIQNYNSSTIP